MFKYNSGYDVYVEVEGNTINIIYKGVILPQYIGSKYKKWKHPYPLVFVPDHGEVCVHRLVAYAFGIWIKGYEIDHIDNNPFNNHPSNLRAISHSGNMQVRRYQKARDAGEMDMDEMIWRSNNTTI